MKSTRKKIGDITVTSYLASHGNPGGPFFSYRIESEGRVISYTGDTEWTESLIDAGFEADLFIAESYYYDKKIRLHLDYVTLIDNLKKIAPKRLILTHMSEDMLSRADELPHEFAEDGMVVEL